MKELPRDISGLTAEWLEGALNRSGISVKVKSLEQTRVIWGTATKVFITAEYSGKDSHKITSKLCIKGGFDEGARNFNLGAAYELEGNFFRDIAPTLSIPLPRCFSAEVEVDQSILILEDMTERGVYFPEAQEGLGLDMVSKALEVMASWQASAWGTKAPQYDWLPVGCRAVRQALDTLLTDELFFDLTGRDIIPALPERLQDPALVRSAYHQLWADADQAELTLSHGDAHVGQTYIDNQSNPAFLDWQGVCLAPWASDVAYFIGGALSPEVRRENERDLLRHYIDTLASRGGPLLDEEMAWLEYRKHTLHGFVWALTPLNLQPEPVVTELARRYLEVIADHRPETLLT